MKSFKLILPFLLVAYATQPLAQVSDYFNQIKTKPSALYHFLKKMPKGGELHYHLAGGAYPEAMIDVAASEKYCLQKKTFNILPFAKQCNDEFSAKELLKKTDLYTKTLQAWSMQDFNPETESGHDHFFNSFEKFLPIVSSHSPELMVDVLQRAAKQNELYLEIMILPDDAQSLASGALIKNSRSLKEKQHKLLADKNFQNNIQLTRQKSNQLLHDARDQLGCDKNPKTAACQIKVKFQYYVLREQPSNNLFAQALNGFAAAANSKDIVAVNLVQPEDGRISLRDYRKQMKIFNFLHKAYPHVHIALHAGELTPDFAKPADLKSHIHDAIFTGKAERIGHGVDIQQEEQGEKTARHMASHQIPVEINLISNREILSVSGKKHPLNYYLKKNVPVVLSTDDEGILRTNLTQQYVEAVTNHQIDYPTLKQINRNALTYNFLPGKNLWQDPKASIPVKSCTQLDSTACKQFISTSPKARLQWKLEKKLQQFEETY